MNEHSELMKVLLRGGLSPRSKASKLYQELEQLEKDDPYGEELSDPESGQYHSGRLR